MIPVIPEHAQYGKLEELSSCWFRQARGQIAEEDKPRVVQGDGQAYFGCVNDSIIPRWGLRLDKTANHYETKYGKAQYILTNVKGKPKQIVFENHTFNLGGMKPRKRLQEMGLAQLPERINPKLRCLGTFKNGKPCTNEAWGETQRILNGELITVDVPYCGVCKND
ncbi:MAG: hypothetical protein CMN00_04895 [Rickettsiales bacterium]|nr:hypothetical protein [Rickettsiales bacterium]